MILYDALKHPTADSFVLVDYYQTLLDALQALKRYDGQDFWYLLVTMPDGSYRLTRYQDLRDVLKAQGDALLNMPLGELAQNGHLDPVPAIPHDDPRTFPELPEKVYVVTQLGVPIAILGDPGRAAVTGDSTLELAGLVKKTSGLAGWGDPDPAPSAPKSVDQAINVGGNAGNITVAGGHIIEGNYVQQIFVGEGAQKRLMREQFRVFESAFPEKSVIGVPAMLGVAVYLPGNPSPFKPDEEPRKVVASDQVAVPMPVNPTTDKVEPVEIEVTLSAANFTISGKATKYLTVWPDGRAAVRWFQLTPQKAGEHTIMIELSHDKRLLEEIRHAFTVEKEATLVSQVLKVFTTPLQMTFAGAKA